MGRFSLLPSLPQSDQPANVKNVSYRFSGGFSAGRLDFADGMVGFGPAGFPTVKYLRIFSSRFEPRPRIASKSSTLLNGLYDLRICKIFSAVTGPIPGTCCNSSEVAALMFTGVAGGFFLARRTGTANSKLDERRSTKKRIGSGRHAMAAI
jgi:hypothetical protein